MAENELQHLICGWPIERETESAVEPEIVAKSSNLSPEDAAAIQKSIPSSLLPQQGFVAFDTVALLTQSSSTDETEQFVLAYTRTQTEDSSALRYHYVQIPGNIFYGIGGDIQPVLNLILASSQPITPDVPLPPLIVPMANTWSMDKNIHLLQKLLDGVAQDNATRLLAILGAAIQGSVIIKNFPQNPEEQVQLVRGLMMLLPTSVRPSLTFSTYTRSLEGALPRIVFSASEEEAAHPIIDWAEANSSEDFLKQPYIAHLAALWDEDMITLAETIRTMDLLAAQLRTQKMPLEEGLLALVKRHQQDIAVRNREALPIEDLMATLRSDIPLIGNLRTEYISHLLHLTLIERNTEATLFIANEIDQNPELATKIQTVFEQELENQPDAVYAFVRTRLSEGVDAQWLERLQQAAQLSLAVALDTGDPDMILSWLTLLSREPSRYELGNILREGILAACQQAKESPHLAEELLAICVKRQPDLIPEFMDDPAFLAALPEHILQALQTMETDAIVALSQISRELFLLALRIVLDAGQPCITTTIIRHLWENHLQYPNSTLPPQYRPVSLMQQMAQTTQCMTNGALETLVSLIWSSSEDELLLEMAPHLQQADVLHHVLATVLSQNTRPAEETLHLIITLQDSNNLQAQESIDILAALLAESEWNEETLIWVERLARLLNQYPETTLSTGMLWKIAEFAASVQNEQMLRIASRRLMAEIQTLVPESQIIEQVERLRAASQWSANTNANILRWWRQFTLSQSQAQLQKIDKAFEGKRSLVDLRSVIQTSIALRRVIGQHTLAEFADAVSITYSLLQALSEGFDPDGKNSTPIESPTIRNELEARSEELSVDARHVLATNLKQLASLVTTLADNRSKPSLMRSDESLERQLATGEHQPQSAIDVVRWLAGYLDGLHKDENAE